MNHKFLILLALTLTALSSCKKESVEPLTEKPVIDVLTLNSTDIQEFTDSLVFTISYRDGDGDLGISDADSTVIEVIDNRDPDNLVFGYHLSPRAPEGAEVAVSGNIEVVLKNVIILNASNSTETTTFDVRIKDRAQHWSNVVTSPEVTVRR